ncbi:Uncharacterized protein TCAP_03701 [Tolypocladium capitatum]|uniref:Uncharacterized protein n=1 Tax=Tolypocladium capitatum TaxID=45235 RepID=A0A2K3QFR7_9HYPO|nr:Uncharacterized protein TCAP_03701 [Tolypocladium capitatum]
MLTRTTRVYANHGMPLECDIYAAEDYPKDTPVFLYFHPGGLVDWGHVGRSWSKAAACDFWRCKWRFASLEPGIKSLPLTWSGITGAFAAALIAHHCQPTPLALLSIQGINTFRHAFFNSSTQLTPEPIQDADMADIIAGPMMVGATAPGAASAFRLEKLRADGSKDPDYKTPPAPAPAQDGPPPKHARGELYDYYTYKNGWLDLVGEIDVGYEWAREKSPAARDRVAKWPPTVVLHGNADYDVPLDVSEQMRDCLGGDKVSLFVADGQPHLYELTRFIDDDAPGMGAVRDAVKRLDEIVGSTTA